MKEPKFELEPNGDSGIRRVFATIQEKRREQTQLDQEEVNKSSHELVAGWPSRMAQIVLDEEAYLRDGGFDPEKIPQALLKKKREVEAMYLERKFLIPNKDYMRLEGAKVIDEIFAEEEPDFNKTRNVAIINIDLNGLKCVNDLSARHENGDKYLEIVVDIFQHGETTKMLQKMGIEPFFGRQNDAGDEFALLLSGEIDLTDEAENKSLDKPDGVQLIEWITEQYQKEVYEKRREDFAQLIDFSDSAVLERTSGIKVSKDFKFRGSISAGCTTLADILLELSVSGESSLTNKNYNDLLAGFFGLMLDHSDRLSSENKRAFKQSLTESDESQERTLAEILQRTEEAVRLHRELEEKDELLRRAQARIRELELQLTEK